MKGVPTKLRGKCANGAYVYGDLIHGLNDDGELDENFTRIVDNDVTNVNDVAIYDVEPDSVAQLVGYDMTGCEICEGDAVEAYLADKFQRASTVNLSATAEVSCRGEALSHNPHYDFFVKGANHDD